MSNQTITDAEIEELLQELDRGPVGSVAANADGIRHLGGGQEPAQGEVILPRGVWGQDDGARLLARSAGALRAAQRRIADLEARLSELDLDPRATIDLDDPTESAWRWDSAQLEERDDA